MKLYCIGFSLLCSMSINKNCMKQNSNAQHSRREKWL